MDTSIYSGIIGTARNNLRRFFALLSLVFLTSLVASAQPPAWFGGNPTVSNIGTLSVQLNYGLADTGRVYVIIFNSNVIADLTPAQIKTWAYAGPSGGRVVALVLTVTAGQVNLPLNLTIPLFDPNRPHALYIVAENTFKGMQANDVRIPFSTKPCPSIFVLTGFDNDQRCVNPPGADKLYAFGFATGVFAGATWTINWGDGGGDQLFFTSLADNQTPPNQTHTYTVHDSCVVKAVLTVKNTNVCAPVGALVEEKSVLLAGRDWDPDGNGELVVADTASGRTDIIYVCEGVETKVAIQDISTWDCQPGTFPSPPGEANDKPRTLQWVYGGQVPNGTAGAGLNTITGNVLVQGLGTAFKGGAGLIGDTVIRTSIGYKSNTMIIPATAVAGEEFHVAFKNWNVCNPFVGLENDNSNYVNVNVIIRVIAQPPRPVVDSIDICEGGTLADRTFHVTSGSVGVLNWYALDPILNPLAPIVFTGANFPAPLIPAGTSKDYWVVDAGVPINGVTCKSEPTQVALIIRLAVANNTISADETLCTGTSAAIITGAAPSGGAGAGTYTYLWQSSIGGAGGPWISAAGVNNTQNYSPGVLTQTTHYRRQVTSSTCVSTSGLVLKTVTPLPSIPTANAGTLAACTSIQANWTAAANATSYRLDVSTSNGFGAGTFVPGFQDLNVGNVTTYNVPGLTAGVTYYYRVRAVNACGTSANSGTITYATLPAAPLAPAANAGTLAACTSIQANWTASLNATSYRLDVSTVNTFASFVAGYSDLNVANVTTYSVTGLTAGVTYYYRVRAVNTCGTSPSSGTITYATLPATPLAPAADAGTLAACTSIQANWTASLNATSYRLDVSTVNTFASFVAGYNNLNVANVTTYSVTGLTAGVTYYYRVRAVNTCGTSPSSGTITYATLPATPLAPAATAGTLAACTSIQANWTASLNATSYRLDVSTVNTFASFVAGYNNLDVANVTTYSVTGLTAGVTYYYRVRAVNTCGTSPSSGTITYATLPATPAAPVATAGTNAGCFQFTANWNASLNATSYRLDVSTVNTFATFVAGYNDLDVGNVTTIDVTGLAGLTTYYYRVRAVNTCGTSLSSNVISFATSVPPAPVATAGTGATCTTIEANWNAAPGAISYRLDVSTVNTFATFVAGYNDLNVGNVTTYSVTGLLPITTYYYRVRAVSACGISVSSNVITYATSPSVAPVATAGTLAACTSIQANWNVAAGATSYRLDVSTVNTFATFVAGFNNLDVGNVLTYNVTGLTAGVTYYYRLRSISVCGVSTNSNTITYATLPATPLAPAANAGTLAACTSIQANWTASLNATSYRLDVSTVNTFATFVAGYSDLNVGNVVTYNVTGLTAGVTYYYRVRAVNACGTSPSSGTITYATLPATPLAPAANAGTLAACTSIQANWTASLNAASYRLDVSTVNTFATFVAGYSDLNVGNVVTYNVTGLTAGVTYYYRVRAVNTCGTSPSSGTITYATLPAAPLAPVANAGTLAACTSIQANWTASLNAASYRLDVSTVNTFATFVAGYSDLNVGNVVTYNVTGLTAGVTYYYRVRAVNTCGTSPSSGTITYATLPATPLAPAATAGTLAACTSIQANWTASLNAASYRLDVSTVNTFATFVAGYSDLDVGNVTTYNVTGLTAGVTYYYRVRAVNSCGTSPSSIVITYATLPATPLAPAATAGTLAACTSIQANWTASLNATSYRLDVSTVNTFATFVAGYSDLNVANVTTYSVTGLTAGVTYYYRVRAVNACGTSPSSGTITYATLPATPLAPAANAGTLAACTSIQANWTASLNASSYRLDVSTVNTFATFVAGYSDLNVGNVVTYNVTGLTAGVTYYYRVRAVNTCGTSPSSIVITYATLPAAPLAPASTAGTLAACSSIQANWTASLNATSYRLDVSTVNTFATFVAGYNNLDVANVTTYSVTGLTAGVTYYYRVRAVNTCGTSPSSGTITYATLPATPAQPGAIAGLTALCPATPNLAYSIAAVPNATTYTWSVPAGWSITSGQGTTSILATSGGEGQGGNISVTAGNTCGTSIARTLAVTVGTYSGIPTSVNIASNNTCFGTSKTLTIVGGSLGTGAIWNWYTGSCGGTLVGTGPSLVVNPAAGSSTTYYVRAEGTCNTTLCVSGTVVVLPDVGVPTTPNPATTTICQGSAPTSYTTLAANATTYIWTVTGAGNSIAGTGTTGTVTWDPAFSGIATITVRANGCSGPSLPASTTVNVTTSVGVPVFTLGESSIRCQAAESVTYTATAVNATGLVYSLDAASLAAGNTINPATGEVTYVGTWFGTTSITATATGCNGPTIKVHTVTVNPIPVTSPIAGDPVICETVLAEVYQVVNTPGSSYTWVVPPSLTITSPQGFYFIIVKANPGVALPTDRIKVVEKFASSTQCVGDTVYFPIIVSPSQPGENVVGPISVCQGATNVVYSVTWTAGTSYSWSLPPGAFITSDPDSSAVAVTFPLGFNGNVSVIETNGACTVVNNSLAVTVHPRPAPTINGPIEACETTSGHIYTTEVGMTNYLWTVSPGGTITAGGTATDNSVTVTWNTTGVRTVSVNYTNANGCTAAVPTDKTVNVYALPVPSIMGNGVPCLNTTGNVYTTEPGMTNYVWTVTGGGTITAGGGAANNTVTVTWGTLGAQSVSVSYRNANLCTAAAPTVFPVDVRPLPVPTVAGPSPVCRNATGNVYTTEAGMTSYVWTVSAGGVITAGGTGNSSVTVTWTTAGAQSVSVSYSNAEGCAAAAPTVYPVTVNPLPVPVIAGPASACLNSTGNVYSTAPLMTNYIWVISAGGTVSAGGSATDNTVTVTWTTIGPKTVSVVYTDGNGCTAASPTIYPVTINSLPVPSISGAAAACVTSTGNVYTTEPGMTNYTWAVSAGGFISAGGGIADNTVTVTWNVDGPQTVSVNYNNANGCPAATSTVKNITVNPLPVPTLAGPAAACVTSSSNVYTTEPGMNNYVWTVSAGGTITGGGGAINNTVIVTWNTVGAQSVTVNYTNGNSCTAAAATVYPVTVNALPVPTIGGPATACAESTGNIYTTEALMTNYVWTVSSGGTITAGGTGTDNAVTVTWTTAGPRTVTVSYTDGNSCTSLPFIYNVTVNPLPVPTIAGPASVCLNSTGNVYTTEAGMTNYNWVVPAGGTITAGGTATDNTVTVTWTTTGAKTISVAYANGNGCTNSVPSTYNVLVNPLPVPTISGSAAACASSVNNLYTTEPGMSSYAWTVSAGGTVTAGGTSVDNTVTVTWVTPGAQTVSVNYTNGNGCTATVPTVKPVTVNPLPVPTLAGPVSACATSTGNVYTTEPGMTGYVWVVSPGGSISAGGGGGSNTVTVTWNTVGARSVSVSYTNGNLCTAAAPTVLNVTVNPLPIPVIAGPAAPCLNSTGNTYTTDAGMSGYIWTVAAGGIITNGGTGNDFVEVTWTTTGAKTVTVNYTNGNGCTAAAATVYNLDVKPLPVPTIVGPVSACITSTGNLYTTEPGMTGYTWTVSAGGTVTAGGGIADNSVTVTWDVAGPQSVSVNYINGNLCTAASATVLPVTVNPLPVPVLAGPAVVCATSTGNVYTTEAGMTNYTWVVSAGGTVTAGGAATNNSVTVTWNTPGPQSVSVSYTNASLCTAAAPTVYPVTVNVLPVPVIAGPAAPCLNSTGNVYTTDLLMTNYIWTVSAGGVITAGGTGNSSVTVTWTTTGAKTVSVNYTNANGCTATVPTVYNIDVKPLPVPTITGNAAACITSVGNVYTTEPAMTNYQWVVSAGGAINAGGGVADNTVTVTWNTAGAQSVSVNYVNANLCTAAAPTVKPVTVNPLPVPVISGPASVCATATNNLYTTEPFMTNYIWVVSAGGTVTGGGTIGDNTVTVTWNTAGPQTVSVVYTNGNGCTAAAPTVYPVTVNPLPVPTITGPSPVCRNAPGNVYTTELGMTNYIWTVSAGGVITAGGNGSSSATVTWTSAGAHEIRVNYINGTGCTAALPTILPVTVNALPVPVIAGPASACITSTGNIYSTAAGMTGYTWTVSAGGAITAGGGVADNTVTVTWNNTGPQLITVNYTDANGCTAPVPAQYPVNINALPVPTIVGPAAACETSVGNLYTTEAGMTGYTWVVSAGGAITAGGGVGDNTVTVTWNTAGARSVSVNYTNLNNCTAAAATVKAVTVNPLPVPVITGPAVVCQNATGNVYTTEIGMANYIWVVSAGGTITAGGNTNNNVVVVTWNTTGPQTVSVVYTNGNGCTAPAATVYNVTVNALPVPTIAGPTPVCQASTGNVYTTEAGMTNYTWVVSPGGTITAGGGVGNNTVTVTWNQAGARTVSVNYTNANGCRAMIPTEYAVTVNPLPIAILSGGETICPGDPATLTIDLPSGQAPFEIDIQGHGTITGYTTGTPIIVSPLVTTTYKITRVLDANGCVVNLGSPNLIGEVTVTVRLLPAITVQPVPRTVCEFGSTTFSVTATGSNLTYQWYVREPLGVFAPVVDGGTYFGAEASSLMVFGPTRLMNGNEYRVDVSGCGVTIPSDIVALTVNQAAEIIIQPRDSTVCQGSGVSFTSDVTGTNLVLKWWVKMGAAPFAPVVDGGGITGSDTEVLTIANVPGSYNNYIYQLRASSSCGAPVTSNWVFLRVVLPPTPVVNPVDREICANSGPVYFFANGSGLIDSIRWQVSTVAPYNVWTDIYDDAVYGGTTSQQLSLVNVPNSYNGNRYRLAFKAACTSAYSLPAVLTVNALPVVDFTAIDPVDVCGGTTITLDGAPSGGSGTYSTHRWGGDIAPLSSFNTQTTNFRTTIAGDYKIDYTVTDSKGCKGSDTLVVRVESPMALFVADQYVGCTDLAVQFTNLSTGYATVLWDFGDGTPPSNAVSPLHTFVNAFTSTMEYTVTLTVTSATGCTSVRTDRVIVWPGVNSDFTISASPVCAGTPVTFLAAPGGSLYEWNFGDGPSQFGVNGVTHTFANGTPAAVTYNVTVITTTAFGCTSSTTKPVEVYPMPDPLFTAIPPIQVMPNATVTFDNVTVNGGAFTYFWRMGDGATSTAFEPSHTYAGPGDYTVTMIASNALCSDSVQQVVRILPTAPIAAFTKPADGCGPLTVTMVNNSQYATSYQWDFGDGGISNSANPTYTYYTSGIYRITLVATGPGGVDIHDEIVEVWVTPVAFFQFAPEKVFVNDENVRFFNLSTGATNYIWDFADGDTSHQKDPFHKYLVKGIFDVTLHAYSANGCFASYTATPGVLVEPAGTLRFATAFIPNKTGPIDGPPTPSTIDMFFFPPVTEQVSSYKLQIFNRWGTLVFESRDINYGWNGYYKGKLVKQGVYVWLVEGKYANGKPFRKSGDVTLLH